MKDIIKEKINIEEIKLVYEDNGKNRDGILPTWLVKYEIDGQKKWSTARAVNDRR